MTISLTKLMQTADRAMMGVPHVNSGETLMLFRYLTDEQRELAYETYLALIHERRVPLKFNAGRAANRPSQVQPRPVSPRPPSRPALFNRSAMDRAAEARRKLEAMRDMEDA